MVYRKEGDKIVCTKCDIYFGVIDGVCKPCKVNKCVYCDGDLKKCIACRGGLKGTEGSCVGHNRCKVEKCHYCDTKTDICLKCD